jgi:ABC-type phosphate/phosphonate transport system substrate-binding protein
MRSDTATLVASTRMYNVVPAAAAAWRRLLHRVIEDSGVKLQIVEHAHPATLSSLWGRADLGCAFMCGWPLALEGGQRPVIAAPVPCGETGPRYHAVFIAAAGAPFQTIEAAFGGRFAFNSRESHSGWNMPQAHIAGLGGAFRAAVGPYGPHQRAAAAVAAGEAEVASIDSLVWALLCRHAPEMTARLRVVGRTADQPSPPLVGSAALQDGAALRLQAALFGLAQDEPGRALLADVCLAGFAPATLADYDATLSVGRP